MLSYIVIKTIYQSIVFIPCNFKYNIRKYITIDVVVRKRYNLLFDKMHIKLGG